MITLQTYNFSELSSYLNTTDVQGTERKLRNYGISFTAEGRGRNRKFTITEISDPFKVFSVFDLGMAPQTDFAKFRYFVYLLLSDEDFAWRPAEMMEEYLRQSDNGISRQVVSKYLNKLSDYGLISMGFGDFTYYKVFKIQGVQCHEIITREEYAKAWKIYWDCKELGYESGAAYSAMYNRFGGVPRKHSIIEKNAFYNDLVDWLLTTLMDELGDKE